MMNQNNVCKKNEKRNNFLNLRTTLSLVLTLMSILLICVSSAFALELSLTPGDASFDHVLSGGYAEVPFTLSTDSKENITINLYHLDDSAVNDWITYEPKPEFVSISQATPFVGKVIVRVPSTATRGDYSIMNKFTVLRPLTPSESDTTADIALSMGQKISISVVSDEISGCTVYSDTIQTESVEGQDVVEKVFLRNDGNVLLSDDINYEVYDVEHTKMLLSGTLPFSVLPTKVETVAVSLPTSSLPAGQYSVSVSIAKCSLARDNLQFTVFAKGEKFVKGDLSSIVIPVRVYNLTKTTIAGEFTNTGDVAVTAHLINKILLDGKVVNIIESELQSVSASQTVTFVAPLQVSGPGKYQVDSYVAYDSYQTAKRTSYVNFIDDSSAKSQSGFSGATIAKLGILLVIAIFLVLIIRRRLKKK